MRKIRKSKSERLQRKSYRLSFTAYDKGSDKVVDLYPLDLLQYEGRLCPSSNLFQQPIDFKTGMRGLGTFYEAAFIFIESACPASTCRLTLA